ncbi:MAG TPA: hypothetical protein VF669_09820 [Tepidisphaeraceae bacterium]|jgi:hypothetical protein
MLRQMIIVLTYVLALSAERLYAADAQGFQDRFEKAGRDFASQGKSKYFVLEPGHQCVLEGKQGEQTLRLVVTVLGATRRIDGVETRVVEERLSQDKKLVNRARLYLAIDRTRSDICCFGKDVDQYENGKVTGHGGSWIAGKDESRFGILVPGQAADGQKFYREIAPNLAMQRAQVVSVSGAELILKESSPLEPAKDQVEVYASTGLVKRGELKLTKAGKDVEPLAKKAKEEQAVAGMTPTVPNDVAREALALVGADPQAEAVWLQAINDPALTPNQRQDLIEDLNENGFEDPGHVKPEELPLVLSRIELIESVAPNAMDKVNADAFAEAYKDLTNIAGKLMKD